MEFVTLNNGVKMPILGYGVYQVSDEEAERTVKEAIDAGYRLIDTAQAYQNEEGVGRAIAASGVAREELFITTKVWLSFSGYEATKEAFNQSLEKLALDYIDLYLIHQPYGDIHGSWRAMEELYEQGKIKAIGVSNFAPYMVLNIAEFNKVKPAVNQIEVNPFTQRVEEAGYFEKYGVQTEAWAPFAEGLNGMFDNEVLQNIGKQYNKSVAQVILRWLVQRNIVVIPKTVNRDRMEQNIAVFDFELSAEDMQLIQSLDQGRSQFFNHEDIETAERFIASKDRFK